MVKSVEKVCKSFQKSKGGFYENVTSLGHFSYNFGRVVRNLESIFL